MPDSLAPDVAEQLLDLREPDGGQHAAVTALLVAAAGPPLPTELTGEDSALRAFRLAYRARRRRRAGLIAGAAVAVLSLGGTAYAAGGNHLPDPVQRTVESLFGGGHGGGEGGDAPPSTAPAPGGGAAATPSPSTGGPLAVGGVEELCRAWEAARADPHAPQVTGEQRRALSHAAKSATGIDDYCRGVLTGAVASQPAATETPAVTNPPAVTGKPGAPGASGASGTSKPGKGGTERSHGVRPSHP